MAENYKKYKGFRKRRDKVKLALLILAAVFLAGCVATESNRANGDLLEQQGFVRTGATEYVKPNAYGLGTGMNQFGAPVKVVPAYGGN
jgi:hypothetical protein